MKTIILKLSGKALSAFIQDEKWSGILSELYKQYDGIILVHGAGSTISDWSEKMDCDVRFVNGMRVTTAEIMDIVAAVQAGLLNQKIISYLHAKGLEAIGLSGIDRNLFVADYLDKKLGFVGYPKLNGDISWVKNLLKEKGLGYLANHLVPKCQAVGFCLEEKPCGMIQALVKGYDDRFHQEIHEDLEKRFQEQLKIINKK